jgi:hypothetical protein
MEALEGLSHWFWIFFVLWCGVFFSILDIGASTFFSDLINPNELYADGEVQELSGFLRSNGVDVPPIQVVVSEDEYPFADVVGYRNYAWTSSFGNYGVIWVRPNHTNSFYIMAHEMAHQAMFSKYPDLEGDHHYMLEFRQWEACLTASSKYHVNLCGMMK